MLLMSNLKCAGFDLKYITNCVETLHDITFEKSRTQLYELFTQLLSEDANRLAIAKLQSCSYHEVKYCLYYTIQQILFLNKSQIPEKDMDLNTIMDYGLSNARVFISTHATALSEGFNPEGSGTTYTGSLNTKQLSYKIFEECANKAIDINQSAFKKQVMGLYREHLDTSPSGLQSYYYASKKQYLLTQEVK